MKGDSDFELQYADVLKECIKLFEEESRYEKEQISLALRVGAKVNKIVDHIEDKEAVFKRLARDIFKARGKLVTPSKISEYRQLYLNFQSIDTVTTLGKSMMNDITVGMLTEMALKDEGRGGKPRENESPLLTMLKKAHCLLDRIEVTIEDKQPEDEELAKIFEELEMIGGKAQTILNAVRNDGGRNQMDLFKRRDTSAHSHYGMAGEAGMKQ